MSLDSKHTPFVFHEQKLGERKKRIEDLGRVYDEVSGFELRFGKFYDPNLVRRNEEKQEIRILSNDHELMEVLFDKIREWLNDKTPKE